VLAEEGLSAIAKIVLKDREALASINPYANTMLLSTLYWPDEVRTTVELDLPAEDFDFKPAELQMAQQLVSAMKGEFTADEYKDEYRQALMAVIEAKVAGQPAERVAAIETPTKIADLMSVLEASVAAAREARASRGAGADVEPTAARKSRKSEPVPVKSRAKAKAETEAEEAPKQARKRKVA
jgi:DNA end-binding protein Ku